VEGKGQPTAKGRRGNRRTNSGSVGGNGRKKVRVKRNSGEEFKGTCLRRDNKNGAR